MILATILLFAKFQDQTVTVFAAASLKDAFTSIAKRYERTHPGTSVVLNFAGSQTLAAQIKNGALADVFASASRKNLDDSEPDSDSIRIFAQNRLTIVVRKGFPGITSARDLAKAPKLVFADAAVPAGKYAAEFLARAAKPYGRSWVDTVNSHVVSRELDVRAVLSKVRLGEADAGIVYVSDAISAKGDVQSVPIPESLNPLAEYPVARPHRCSNPEGALLFIDFLLSQESQKEIERFGLLSPFRASNTIRLTQGGKLIRNVALPLSPKLGKAQILVQPRGRERIRYEGVPVEGVFKGLNGKVTFVAADGSSRTFRSGTLTGKAVLMRHKDGNYQLVISDYDPDAWVNRIRSINFINP